MKPASELSPEFALLGLLDRQPMHGYELHQRLEADLATIWRISQSQAYNILKRLQRQGLVRGEAQAQASRPARTILSLTPAGKQRFEEWLHAPAGCSARAIRVEFVTRLYFTAHDAALTRSLIERQTNAVQAGVARLRRDWTALPANQPFNRMSLELRLRQLEPILDWLQAMQAKAARNS